MQIKEVTIGKLISATYLICSLLLIGACSDGQYDEQLDSLYDEHEVICVETQMKVETKGTPVTNASQLKDMGVFCSWTQNADWQATASLNKMFNRKMKHNESGAWAYEGDPVKWDAENTNQRYSFFSYAPFATGLYDATSNAVGNGIVVTEGITTGVPQLKYTVPVNCVNQPDLMVAVPQKNIRPTLGKVPMDMKHALTCVGFQVQGRGEIITGIAIQGVSLSGNLLMDGSNPKWTDLSTPVATDLSTILNSNPSVAGSSMSTNLIAGNGYLMMIPQILTSSAKLVISFSDGTSRKLSLDKQIWEPGKRVNYQITITDGGIILVNPSNLGILYLGTDAKNRNITVTTDPQTLQWTFKSENPEWFKISLSSTDSWSTSGTQVSGTGSKTIYTFAPENTTGAQRTTSLLYLNGIPNNRKVSIIQFPKDDGQGTPLQNSYVGAFWRSNQTEERFIKIPQRANEEWAASVVWMDARWQDGDIFFSNKSANWTPGNTQPLVINVADRQSDVSGKGNIQFRIGLKESSFTPSPEVPARYAVIALTHTNNTKVQYIYLRQGEGADYVMTGTNAVKWSVYNLGNINGTPGTTPATPVDFPTQGGYFYQWGYSPTDNSPRPYSPVGSISGWTSAAVNTVVKYSLGSISPSGFKLPIVEDFNMLFKCKKAFGYYADGFFDRRQIGTPQSGTPGSNSAVSTGNDGIAYNGCIFINPETNASLFLPVAGYRATAYSGSLEGQGTYGSYWTSVATTPGRSMSLFFQLTSGNVGGENANNGFSIRCVQKGAIAPPSGDDYGDWN